MHTIAYPVTRETVATAAAGAVARELSLLFPSLMSASGDYNSLICALSSLRDECAIRRKSMTLTLLQSRYQALREDVLTRVQSDATKAHEDGRLHAFFAAHRAYLVNLIAGKAMDLPKGAPRQPNGADGWLVGLQGALTAHPHQFQLCSNDSGHYLALVQKAAA